MTKKRVIWLLALILAGAIFLGCAVYFIRDYLHYRSITDIGAYDNFSVVSHIKKEVEVPINFDELEKINEDIYAWINIPGDDPEKPLVDYPILQSNPNDDDNYYLDHNVNRKSSVYGAIYTQNYNNKDFGDFNTLIYGHNMRNGNMFHDLHKFRDKSFWEGHKYFTFDTILEHHTYEIVAVFTTTASVGRGFAYHLFVNAATEEEFDQYVARCKQLALYDTGVTAEYGDKLISLSTCEYSQVNGRLVLVAKRIN